MGTYQPIKKNQYQLTGDGVIMLREKSKVQETVYNMIHVLDNTMTLLCMNTERYILSSVGGLASSNCLLEIARLESSERKA